MRIAYKQASFDYSDGLIFFERLANVMESIGRVSGPYSQYDITFRIGDSEYFVSEDYGEVIQRTLDYFRDRMDERLGELINEYDGKGLKLEYCEILVAR